MSSPDPLQELVDVLHHALTRVPASRSPVSSSASTAASPSPPMIASPMATPAPYSGSVEDCNGFLLQCLLALEMQPHLYPDDRAKVAFIISHLDGKALHWAEPLRTQNNPIVSSLSSFTEHFKEVLGKPAWDSSLVLNPRGGQWLERAGPDHKVFVRVWTPACSCIKLCLEEHQDQPAVPTTIRQPEPVSPPEPASNAMHLGHSCISSVEPPPPGATTVTALLDSGSAGNFISGTLCHQLHLRTAATPKVYQIHTVTEKPLRQCILGVGVGEWHVEHGEDSFELHSVDLELEAVEKQIRDLQVKQAQLQQRKAAVELPRARTRPAQVSFTPAPGYHAAWMQQQRKTQAKTWARTSPPPPPPVFEIPTQNRFASLRETACDAVIIGDSIVRHVRATAAKGKVHTRCLPGARVLDVSAQVPAILKKNIGAVVLHAGTNDIRLRQTEILKKDFRSLVELVCTTSPTTRIIVSGPLPTFQRGIE
ncbi:hypothetical protein QTP86_034162, partial [Hemibagrus guttatus]